MTPRAAIIAGRISSERVMPMAGRNRYENQLKASNWRPGDGAEMENAVTRNA